MKSRVFSRDMNAAYDEIAVAVEAEVNRLDAKHCCWQEAARA